MPAVHRAHFGHFVFLYMRLLEEDDIVSTITIRLSKMIEPSRDVVRRLGESHHILRVHPDRGFVSHHLPTLHLGPPFLTLELARVILKLSTHQISFALWLHRREEVRHDGMWLRQWVSGDPLGIQKSGHRRVDGIGSGALSTCISARCRE